MIRSLLIIAALSALAGCKGTLRSVERGQWQLVTTDDGKGQELITQDSYEQELIAGRERKVKLAIDERPPVLHEAVEKLSMKVGEVLRFRVNEGTRVDLMSDDLVADVYWTQSYRVDGWKGDQAVEGRESLVFVKATGPGKGKLKLIDATWGTHDYELTVK